MKQSEIRLIQQNLLDNGLFAGAIDGKRESKISKAIESALPRQSSKLPDGWQNWSDKRQAIAFAQLLCHENHIDAGQVDGFYGPTTENALNQLAGLLNSGVIPRGFGDINPLRLNQHNYPLETEYSLNEFYGNPCEITLAKVHCPPETTPGLGS
ncbi:conserved hypothetical protein [methanotrophic bacterial endosymbiont of Bathymodiolus sp.]|nr:conserved hypothetical protein [methanotrophic bacterial endosymbiont of Bathymodiolus sp.]